MGVKIRRRGRLSAVKFTPGASAMRGLGHEVASAIVSRTRSGRSEDGGMLKRKADGQPSTLTDTGQLLDGLDVLSTTDRRVMVGFRTRRSRQVAGFLMDGGRRFLGLDGRMVQMVVRRVKGAIGRARR